MMDLLPNFQSFQAFLGLLLGFGFVIFVHELGHFLAAKWVGIKVTQFAIGFGHAVLSYRKGIGVRVGSTTRVYDRRIRAYLQEAGETGEEAEPDSARLDAATEALGLSETEYRLNWMPLGGYVKMLGQEDMDPKAASQDPRAFNRKSIGARALVISAGVVMNVIFGVLFFILCFMRGVEFPPATVGGVIPQMPAAEAFAEGHAEDPAYEGLKAGDRLLMVGDRPVDDFMDFAVGVALARRGQTLRVTVERGGDRLVYPITPRVDKKGSKLMSVGILRPISLQINDRPHPPLPAELVAAGVRPGMTVTTVDGRPVDRHHVFLEAVAASGGKPVAIGFTDEATGTAVTVEMQPTPLLRPSQTGPPHLFGLVPATVVLETAAGSPAAEAGTRAGDVFAKVDGVPWPYLETLQSTITGTEGRPFEVSVLRDGETVSLGSMQTNRHGLIGVTLGFAMAHARVSRCLADEPFGPLDLLGGTRIAAIGDVTVRGYADMQRALHAAVAAMPEGGSLTVRYELPVKEVSLHEATVAFTAAQADALAAAGWGKPDGLVFRNLLEPVKADSPLDAAMMGIRKTHQFILQTYSTLHRLLFEHTVKPSHLRGPVGIMDEGTKVARQGWPYLLFFLGLISVNLAVINFLPIPIVDGGLMVFLIIEKLKGSPVSARIQTAAFIVGLVLIGSIFLITLRYDIPRLFGGG